MGKRPMGIKVLRGKIPDYGDGDGYGYGFGYGDGDGAGDSNDSRFGDGYGAGDGYSYGFGYGFGGSGYGYCDDDDVVNKAPTLKALNSETNTMNEKNTTTEIMRQCDACGYLGSAASIRAPHYCTGYIKINSSTVSTAMGWECPKCGSVYAPTYIRCDYCGPKPRANKRKTKDL